MFLSFIILAAEAGDPSYAWVGTILQNGIAGGVLVWFMLKHEKWQRRSEEAQDRTTRAMISLSMSNAAVITAHRMQPEAEVITMQCDGLRKELDAVDARRAKGGD